MTRRAVALIILLLLPVAVYAQHGAEAAHSGEHSESHVEAKFLGLPFWIWKLTNMILFFGLLVYLLKGPVSKAFSDRTQAIRDAATEARERRAKADQMATDIQARLSRLEGEVQAIHERAQTEGERQKREMIAAAEAEAQKIVSNAQSEVENRLRHARKELTEYAGHLAADRAEKLLREKITDEDQQKLFRESLSQVEGARS